mgnify:CR=1 FL=1
MSLKTWLVTRELKAQVKSLQTRLDAARAALAGKEASMPVWFHTLLVIFAGGALAAVADALANGFTPDRAGFTRLATSALAGGLVALVAWLKQSPLGNQKGDSALPERLKGAGKLVLLLALGLIPLAGCASAQMRLGRDPRPLAPDPEVVESLVCHGHEAGAARYVELRSGSLADRIEAIERARKATSGKPGCCAAEGCEGSK